MATVRQHKNKLLKEIKIGKDVSEGTWLEYDCYEEYPEVFELTVQDIGKDIWLAGRYKTVRATLKDVQEGYYEVMLEGEFRTLYKNEAILHPHELTKERLEEFGYEVKDGRKS